MAFAEDLLITVIFGDSQPIIHHVESIVKVAYCDRHLFSAVFNRIPEQVLQQLLEAR